VVAVAPILIAWAASQVSPAWDSRYLAVILAPVLMLAAAGLARTGRIGIAALAVVAVLWLPRGGPVSGSDAFQLGRAASPRLRAGDLVVVTAFAQVPVVAHYLPSGVRYATPLGALRDPRVVDWRDAGERFARARLRRALLDRVGVGSRLLLVVPVAWDDRSAQTALGREERRLSGAYEQALLRDARFSLVATVPRRYPALPSTWMLTGFLLRKNHA
jgi:mannosyltransferase